MIKFGLCVFVIFVDNSVPPLSEHKKTRGIRFGILRVSAGRSMQFTIPHAKKSIFIFSPSEAREPLLRVDKGVNRGQKGTVICLDLASGRRYNGECNEINGLPEPMEIEK
jgi:hypothetical protein